MEPLRPRGAAAGRWLNSHWICRRCSFQGLHIAASKTAAINLHSPWEAILDQFACVTTNYMHAMGLNHGFKGH
jgi:hypothetical protein